MTGIPNQTKVYLLHMQSSFMTQHTPAALGNSCQELLPTQLSSSMFISCQASGLVTKVTNPSSFFLVYHHMAWKSKSPSPRVGVCNQTTTPPLAYWKQQPRQPSARLRLQRRCVDRASTSTRKLKIGASGKGINGQHIQACIPVLLTPRSQEIRALKGGEGWGHGCCGGDNTTD